ncbi:MAG TPA: hypothetical protein PLX89_10530 [Verrucomicrobiota bacterium]|nr:hypothetical protein [Verrucomicrobiales bacterium]HRI13432.1 hypothetical protein [Verrucomicrobiota bacterium]
MNEEQIRARLTLPLDLGRLKVRPLAERKSLTRVEDILISPNSARPPLPDSAPQLIRDAAERIRAARVRDASVILMYGAHLLRNGAAPIVTALMENGWITHLATNGAGTIHDWEYAWLGRSTEGVEENVATGTFGAWDETGHNIHLALLAGALQGLGYGRALGRFIMEDGCTLPTEAELEQLVRQFPDDPLASSACELLAAMRRFGLAAGRHALEHRWKHASILAQAWRLGVPLTVHPGIGYDIISCHPMFNGAAIGRAAAEDFRLFGGSVDRLDGGVVLSVGSAIMAPQVFEKSLSCVHNLRFQAGRPPVAGHNIYVVDLQDGGGWDWTQGEPPKTNPAYYLRFCKSFSRMGGSMQYLQCDNLAFVHHLWAQLSAAKVQ